MNYKEIFKQYIWICGQWNKNKNISYQSLWNDVDHSVLLERLLSGKKELEFPPPLRYSSPNYLLGELGYYETDDFNLNPLVHDGYIIIDQSLWKIEEIIENNTKFILSYREKCPYYKANIEGGKIILKKA